MTMEIHVPRNYIFVTMAKRTTRRDKVRRGAIQKLVAL